MLNHMLTAVSCAAILAASPATSYAQQAQVQVQTNGAQHSSQNNGSTYQSSYQVNGPNGAVQGQGTGNNSAQADYNASAAARNAPVHPHGSVQVQGQAIEGNAGWQGQATVPPRSNERQPRRGSVTPQ